MTCFEWDSALETGDERIDDQHRSLFALAMAFVRFARQGKD